MKKQYFYKFILTHKNGKTEIREVALKPHLGRGLGGMNYEIRTKTVEVIVLTIDFKGQKITFMPHRFKGAKRMPAVIAIAHLLYQVENNLQLKPRDKISNFTLNSP